MASEGGTRYPAPNEWDPYDRGPNDARWTRRYINGSWPGRDGDRVVVDEARRQFHEEIRLVRDPQEITMNIQRRYEATLVELRHTRRELEYYREMSSRQLAEMVRVAERTAPAAMTVGHIGADWSHSPIAELAVMQRQNEMAVMNAFRLPTELFAEKLANERGFSIFGNEKKSEPTGRIIDLES